MLKTERLRAVGKINKENLIPLSTEKARIIGSKGGKASVKSRRKKKLFKEIANMMLDMNAPNSIKENMTLPIDTVKAAVVAGIIQAAIKGDVKAAVELKSWIGEDNNGEEADALEKLIESLDKAAK